MKNNNKRNRSNQKHLKDYEKNSRKGMQKFHNLSSGSRKGRSGRVAVFIDGSNLYYAQKNMKWNIDPVRLLQ